MYCVGLIGGIASGKSTVAALFATYGAALISADSIARELTSPAQPALRQIESYFGSSIINAATGELNRRALRELIFKNRKQRLWLENLLHPLIRERIIQKLGELKAPYSIIEIPLLMKREDYPYLNRILLISTDKEHQIERIRLRDTSSREDALAIIEAQADDRNRKELADDIILNNGTLPELENKVRQLHERYLELSQST